MGPKRNIYTKLGLALILLTMCASPVVVMTASDRSGNITDGGLYKVKLGIPVAISILLVVYGAIKDKQDGLTGVGEYNGDPLRKPKRFLSVVLFGSVAAVGLLAAMIPWDKTTQRTGLMVGVAGVIATVVQLIRNYRSEKREGG